jgi:hypothetical protein
VVFSFVCLFVCLCVCVCGGGGILLNTVMEVKNLGTVLEEEIADDSDSYPDFICT